jgi:hypothetical protein
VLDTILELLQQVALRTLVVVEVQEDTFNLALEVQVVMVVLELLYSDFLPQITVAQQQVRQQY